MWAPGNKQSGHSFGGGSTINEQSSERVDITAAETTRKNQKKNQDKKGKQKSEKSYADDMRVLSALSFVLGGTFFGIFNSFMNHAIPSFCDSKSPERTRHLITLYVVLATIGFMFLFSSALISYELFLLFRDQKIIDPEKQLKYLKFCYVFTFIAIVLCFTSHAISLYIAQCQKDTLLMAYVPTLGLVCLATIIFIGVLNNKFHTRDITQQEVQ